MNNLFYYEDSGSLNEAFSDIIGEAIDILNKDSGDTINKRMPGECTTQVDGVDTSFRWMLGEEIPLYGPIRDMNLPECLDHPSNHRSILYDFYWCFDENDGYGVHTNSGVFNKVFATLSDGGYQYVLKNDDYQITGVVRSNGVGINNALNLMFATYADLTEFSDYQDAAVAMSAQCELLVTGNTYKPVINGQAALLADTFIERTCRKANAILNRAYLFDDPIVDSDCDRIFN